MGKPSTRDGVLPASEYIGCVEGTRGSETSQYPQEEKTIVIPSVAASERGSAQTLQMSSPQALSAGGCGMSHGSIVVESGESETFSLVESTGTCCQRG